MMSTRSSDGVLTQCVLPEAIPEDPGYNGYIRLRGFRTVLFVSIGLLPSLIGETEDVGLVQTDDLLYKLVEIYGSKLFPY